MTPNHDSDLIDAWADGDPVELDSSDPEFDDTLRSCQRLETLFCRVRLPATMAAGPFEATDEPPQLPGFALLERLGRGGFGTVYLADDQRLQRRVAIKVPRLGRWDFPDFQERFLREARLAAQLNHPGIVTLYDVIERDQQCFLVSEYVEGGTLESRLADGPLASVCTAEIALHLAEALAHAHQRNIVHRDLKPTNILIDGQGKPRITDFGLAIRDDRQDESPGQVAGTIEYMSPEQLPGERQFVDGRTDIWSLGVILYRMLTGRLPFGGHDRDALFREIRERDPKPPRQINPRIPLRLQEICSKCLRKDTADRYSSAEEIVAELRKFLASQSPRWYRRWMLLGCLIGTLGISATAIRTQGLRHNAIAGTDSRTVSPHNPHAVDLRIESLKLLHFEYNQDSRGKLLGTIGIAPDPVLLNDEIRIELRFSRPACFYLMEFTSAGQWQLHFPLSEESQPDRRGRFDFPTTPDANLCLSDGAGLHAIVVVASVKPLPPFREWRATLGDVPWESSTGQGIWQFDNHGFDSGYFMLVRGEVRQRQSPPPTFAKLCQHLSERIGDAVIRAVAFTVEPAQ